MHNPALIITRASDSRHQEIGTAEQDQGAADALESALRQVVSDIGDYYEKKIQMLQIRADRVRASRPPTEQVELVERLQLVYRGHPNYGELWTDMFARMTKTDGPSQVREKGKFHWSSCESVALFTFRAAYLIAVISFGLNIE